MDKAYQYVAKEVMKTPVAKEYAIVIATSKQFLAYYLLKSSSIVEGHHLVGSLIKVVMSTLRTLAFPNCHNFILGSKRFVHTRMWTNDNFIVLKDHSTFKYIHDNIFLGQVKTMNDVDIKYHVVHWWWLSYGASTK